MHEISHAYHVQASTLIPCDNYFGPLCYKELQELISGRHENTKEDKNVIEITVLNKVLISRTKTTRPWYVYLQPARDIFEQNLQLYRSRDGHVFIRSTKTIQEGDELKYWFDDKLAREMNVPYLTPANIVGICRYKCHICHKEFAQPNPLKLHIMEHAAEKTEISSPKLMPFFHRQSSSIPSVNGIGHFSPTITAYTLTKQNNGHWDHNAHTFDNSKTTNADKISLHNKICDFGPQTGPRYTLTASIELVPRLGYSPDQTETMKCQETKEKDKAKCFAKIKFEEQEPMELLKQNNFVVPSKKGHLCVFCGKLYSRKYGLKIHLRTHTGFKPLRCKYCHRAFGDPSNLNKHIRLHAQGSTPYQCTYCDKVLVRRRDLVRHLKSRHSDAISKC